MREEQIRYLLDNWQTDGTDECYMRCALALAELGAAAGEVPVGAVLVREGKMICGDYNGREETKDATYHAELSVIRQGCVLLGGWRLTGCTLYVTLEPCPMCAGAIWNAHLPKVVYGAKDARAGAMGSVLHLNSYPLNWKPTVVSGVLEEECRQRMQGFFGKIRKK